MELESIIEWVVLGIGFDYQEFFEDENEGRIYGQVSFMRWWEKVNKRAYLEDIANKSMKVKNEMEIVMAKEEEKIGFSRLMCPRK